MRQLLAASKNAIGGGAFPLSRILDQEFFGTPRRLATYVKVDLASERVWVATRGSGTADFFALNPAAAMDLALNLIRKVTTVDWYGGDPTSRFAAIQQDADRAQPGDGLD
jgi:hypothetical protein